MIGFILWIVVIGLIAGFVARALVPGDDSMSIVATLALGIAGSLVGGFIGYLLFGKDIADGAFQTAGIVGSIVGAVVVLLGLRLLRGSGSDRSLS